MIFMSHAEIATLQLGIPFCMTYLLHNMHIQSCGNDKSSDELYYDAWTSSQILVTLWWWTGSADHTYIITYIFPGISFLQD